MRFVSWNVNGIRAVLKKNFLEVFDAFNADIFAIQETKCQVGQVELDLPGYHQYWSAAEKKGYSGTAVFTREEPLRVLHGLGNEYLDAEGRIVACEFPQFWFVNVYTPNSQMELARIDHRMEWDDAFRDFCKGEKGIFLIGEAAGFISASSLEGISSAIGSAKTLSGVLNHPRSNPNKRYWQKTLPLRLKLFTKVLKSPFLYRSFLRKLVMKSGIQSIKITETLANPPFFAKK